jgi:hypothetical protein
MQMTKARPVSMCMVGGVVAMYSALAAGSPFAAQLITATTAVYSSDRPRA